MLQAESLSYFRNEQPIIQDISLTFSPGILYGILGPNGSGKTTLLKLLTGIWEPTKGHILWQGNNLLQQPRREISRTISLVALNPFIDFDYTVLDIVSMGRYSHNSSKRDQEVQEWALTVVDAWHLRKRLISQLSHGERQRVYIAQALATESSVLLLDEPTASLDVRHQLEIWQLLQNLLSQGKIVIVTSHDLIATQRFCDQVAVLNHGRCVGIGPAKTIVHSDLLQSVFGVTLDSEIPYSAFSLP